MNGEEVTCDTPHDGLVMPKMTRPGFYSSKAFLTRDKKAAPIPCGRGKDGDCGGVWQSCTEPCYERCCCLRCGCPPPPPVHTVYVVYVAWCGSPKPPTVLTDESFDPSSLGVHCALGSDWDSTKLASGDSKNFHYPDLEVPVYQSLACCASNARFGFTGKYSTVTAMDDNGRAINDPFKLTPIDVVCEVERKAYFEIPCNDGTKWTDYKGTGKCGVRGLYNFDGTKDNEVETALEAWIAANGPLEAHEYCQQNNLEAACEQYEALKSTSLSSNYNEPCDSQIFSGYQLTCPIADASNYQTGPEFSNTQKSTCKKCHAVTKAFSAFACSPRQADFISGGKFRVCKSACAALFDACGLPTHRGGIFTASDFLADTAAFEGDYTDAVSMCENMWKPHEDSIWSEEGIGIEVVDDEVEGHEGCVALEREIYELKWDSQNLIFPYNTIRSGEGYCSLEDPLYNHYRPCQDLQEALDSVNVEVLGGRRLTVAQGGRAMYSIGELERAQFVLDGWPWENDDLVWGGVVGGTIVVFLITILLCVYCTRKRVYGDGDGDEESVARDDESGTNSELGLGGSVGGSTKDSDVQLSFEAASQDKSL